MILIFIQYECTDTNAEDTDSSVLDASVFVHKLDMLLQVDAVLVNLCVIFLPSALAEAAG